MDINRSNLEALYIGYKAAFQRGLRSRENAEAWRRIATLMPSSTAKEVYPWLGQAPRMRQWIGDRVIKQMKAHKYEIVNKPFELTVGVEREAVEDDTFNTYTPMFEEMGVSTAEWPNDVIFGMLKDGETALAYDEVPFFSANHPHKIEGTVSNLGAGASAPWYVLDVSRALKPLIWQLRKPPKLVKRDQETDENVFNAKTFIYGMDSRGNAGFGFWQMAYKSKAALDETNLKAALQVIREHTNDEGSSLGLGTGQLLLVVPPELEFAAKQLVNATLTTNGGSNVLAGVADVYVTNLVRE